MACGVTLDTAGGKANHEFRGAGSGRHLSFIYVGRIFVSFLFSKLAMRYSREAQGAGDTSASFTLDIVLPAFGSQSQQCVTVIRHREQGKLQLHLRWMYFCKFLDLKANNELGGTRGAEKNISYVVSCFASFLPTKPTKS